MGPNETERQPAETGRAPTWEKTKRRPYIIMLIIALLLSLVCLSLWRRERAATEARVVAALTESAGKAVPAAAEEITAVYRQYGAKWRSFIREVDLIIAKNYADEDIARLCKGLFNDPDIVNAWIILAPGAGNGKPAYAVMSGRDMNESGRQAAKELMQDAYYIMARERNSARVRPLVRSEDKSVLVRSPGAPVIEWYLGDGYTIERSLTLLADGPVTSAGSFAGAAGFEADIQEILDMMEDVDYKSGLRLFLVDPDGKPVVSSSPVSEGEEYAEAFAACAAKVADGGGFEILLSGSGAAGTFAAFAPVDAGDGGRQWFLAAVDDMYEVSVAGKGWLLIVVLIWLAILFTMSIIHQVKKQKKRKADKTEAKLAVAAMPPETAAIFKKLEFKRKVYYILCALFCILAMFFLRRADKRFRDARLAADTEAAAKAINSMKPVVAVGFVIGFVLFFLNIVSILQG